MPMAARRRKVRLSPFPPDGENCARFLAPPLQRKPTPLGFALGAAFGGLLDGKFRMVRFHNCAWVCRANAFGANPGGPVWDRPLRRRETVFVIRRRGGSQTRPQFYCVHTEKGGNKHSLKHKNTGGPAGPPVFYFSFCSFIIATFRTISSR